MQPPASRLKRALEELSGRGKVSGPFLERLARGLQPSSRLATRKRGGICVRVKEKGRRRASLSRDSRRPPLGRADSEHSGPRPPDARDAGAEAGDGLEGGSLLLCKAAVGMSQVRTERQSASVHVEVVRRKFCFLQKLKRSQEVTWMVFPWGQTIKETTWFAFLFTSLKSSLPRERNEAVVLQEAVGE